MATAQKKAEIVKELSKAGVLCSEEFSLPELMALKKRHLATESERAPSLKKEGEYMKGLAGLRKDTLANAVAALGLTPMAAQTRGDLLLTLRERIPEAAQEKMRIGKHQGLTYAEIIENHLEYGTWAVKEVEKSSTSSEEIIQLAMLTRVIVRGGLKDRPRDVFNPKLESESGDEGKKEEKKESTSKDVKPQTGIKVKEEPVSDEDEELISDASWTRTKATKGSKARASTYKPSGRK